MEFNKLVFAGLSVGCLAAAAGGSYLAVRQNQSSAYARPQSDELGRDGAVEPKAPPAVTESEGIIAPEPVKPQAVPVEPAAPARRAPAVNNSRSTSRASRVVERPSTRPSTRDAQDSAPSVARSGQATEHTSAPAAATNGGTMWETRPSVQPSAPEYREPEPPPPPPPPAPEFIDVTVP